MNGWMYEWVNINECRVLIDGKIFKISVKLVYKLISDLSSLYPGKQGVPNKFYNFSKFFNFMTPPFTPSLVTIV